MQRAEFETKLNRVCLHIYKEEHYEEDYQMPMLRQNRLDGILEVEGCEVDGKARYTYEVSGLTSMKTMYENACIKKQEIEAMINRILEVTEILQRYMLDPNCLVLKPEYIFNKEGRWFFCYFPGMEEDLCQLFHELTEYFVKMLDYEDTEGIFLAYELHKATLQEHYDLELIMKEYKGRESERNKMIRGKQKPVRSRNERKGDIRRKAAGEKGSYKQADRAGYAGKNQGRVGELYGQGEVEPQHGKAERIKGGHERKENTGYDYGRAESESAGCDYGRAENAGYDYEIPENSSYSYSDQESAGVNYRTKERIDYKYGNHGNWEEQEEDYESHGNIFSVADEDDYGAERAYKSEEKNDQRYTADRIHEERTGGWWKSWRKAANGIRRKRWGSWDDLILETDGQEDET